jgi:hypothetical protein
MLYVNPNVLSKNVQLQVMKKKFGPLKTIIISNEWSTTKFSSVVQNFKKIFNKCCNFHNIKLKFMYFVSKWKTNFILKGVVYFHFNSNNKLYTYTKSMCLMKKNVWHTSIFILNHCGKNLPFMGGNLWRLLVRVHFRALCPILQITFIHLLIRTQYKEMLHPSSKQKVTSLFNIHAITPHICSKIKIMKPSNLTIIMWIVKVSQRY